MHADRLAAHIAAATPQRGSDRLAWPVAAGLILAVSAGAWLAILVVARWVVGS